MIFFALLLTMAVTFFTRNSYRGVKDIVPEVLTEPVQESILGGETISFTKDDYKYELTPIDVYEISGLIVHRLDYRWFSIYKKDSVFPLDLCMMWGDDVGRGIYQSKNLSFSQDSRFCWWQWSNGLKVNNNEISNSHLLVDSDKFEEKLNSLNEGDQVRIKGYLVNVSAVNTGNAGEYDPLKFSLNTSTTRDDLGAGACEIIYIKDIEILKKGNPISVFLFSASKYGLVLFSVWLLCLTIYKEIFFKWRKQKTNFEIE